MDQRNRLSQDNQDPLTTLPPPEDRPGAGSQPAVEVAQFYPDAQNKEKAHQRIPFEEGDCREYYRLR